MVSFSIHSDAEPSLDQRLLIRYSVFSIVYIYFPRVVTMKIVTPIIASTLEKISIIGFHNVCSPAILLDHETGVNQRSAIFGIIG